MTRRARACTALLLGISLIAGTSCSEPERDQSMRDPGNYQPRFVDAGGEHEHTNRLAAETSPYLLQHAHNPVDWYPWGPKAFAAAREQDKPIFLSIGYSTCYWCHVMERESFENEAVAALMNEFFICIKVDREERPDVDDLYMTAVQLFNNGSGGWPMSVFLEPVTLKPFYAGTYFPPDDMRGRPGFSTLLRRVSELWSGGRDQLLEQADKAAASISADLQSSAAPVALDLALIDDATTRLLASWDQQLGGFGAAPKFPQPDRLLFLQQVAASDAQASKAVHHTLDAMAMGGMYDQAGGGFHRYSTDARWLVPHFEKMLYDNAALAESYARSYESTHDPFHARVLRETLDYVLREMTTGAGRFFSAQDAEVDALEGASYIWTREQFAAVLKEHGLEDELGFAEELYGLDQGTNFRDPHHPEAEPANVLYLSRKPQESEYERIDRIDRALLAARSQRKQPITDDKTLTGWNGLMIAGFAEGGRVLDDATYLDAARHAAAFLLDEMRGPDGILLRSYRDGRASIEAFLEDYAYLAHGLFSLHAATGEARWQQAALQLLDEARQIFGDSHSGGYFDSLPGQSDLFVRLRSRHDGATPSGNSQMLLNLLTAHRLTGNARYLREASATLASISQRMSDYPTVLLVAARGLDEMAREYPGYLPADSGTRNAARVPVRVNVDPQPVNGVVTIRLEIADGFHVNAHEPGDPGLTGLSLVLVGEGVELEVEYPAGTPLQAEFSENEILVYTGSVEFKAHVRKTGAAPGRPRLLLRWQACDDQVCLAPAEDVLPVLIGEE